MPFEAPDTTSGKTLDEPVMQTLVRDLDNVWLRTKILFSRTNEEQRISSMGTYDLWGPGLYFILFSLICSSLSKDDTVEVFTIIFLTLTIGSLVLTINGKLLESNM